MPRYTPIEHIATAGQGTVWIAEDARTNRRVALKYLHPKGSDADIARKRFIREVQTQMSLLHPGVMPIVAHDLEANPPWYAMPVADQTLAGRLQAKLPLSTAELLEVVPAALAAISAAHDRRIIHRDLKPENILRLSENGSHRWVVADFGLCLDASSMDLTITRSSITLGSVRYMSPEQFDDAHRVGPTSDIYSFGCILYQCLTGDAPAYRELDYKKVPVRLRSVVEKATALRRGDRYHSIQLFGDAFGQAVDRESLDLGALLPTTPNPSASAKKPSWLDAKTLMRLDLNQLPLERFIEIMKYLLGLLGYELVDSSLTCQTDMNFLVEDRTHGLVPVRVGRHRYLAPSADLHRLSASMYEADAQRGVFMTTGRLCKEALSITEEDRRIIVLEGTDMKQLLSRLPK